MSLKWEPWARLVGRDAGGDAVRTVPAPRRGAGWLELRGRPKGSPVRTHNSPAAAIKPREDRSVLS